eukprot:scaffold125875_cov30-Tisochrysis_lutea.AAC.5
MSTRWLCSTTLPRPAHSNPTPPCTTQGELLTDAKLPCTAVAATRVEMLEMAREDVRYLFRRRPLLMSRIQQRARLGYTASWAAIGANSVFATFSMSQVRFRPINEVRHGGLALTIGYTPTWLFAYFYWRAANIAFPFRTHKFPPSTFHGR